MKLRRSIQLCLLAAVAAPMIAQSQVLWERYAGSDFNSYAEGELTGPQYKNNGPTAIQDLLLLATDHNNAVDEGTEPQFNWPADSQQLCSYSNPIRSEACVLGALGQVSYAIIRFPEVGTYIINTRNDDQVRLDISTDLGSPSYRNSSFTFAGELSTWSAGPRQLATYTTDEANTCLLVRLAWNNNNTRSELIAEWQGPEDLQSTMIPATNIHDPRSQPSACSKQAPVVPAEATPVPTTGAYALILLSALLAAAVFIRRKAS